MLFLRRPQNIWRILISLACLTFSIIAAEAGDNLTISREFNLITSKNATGYFKPLFTTIGESFNANTYALARFGKQWRIGFDISVCGMLIPSSQKTFDAQLPEEFGNTSITQTVERRGETETRNASGTTSQPTIYGANSNPIFSAPQTSVLPASPPKQPATATYMEGNNASFVAGAPAVQFAIGLPTQTELRLRFIPLPIQDVTATYFGIMASQQFNQLFGLFADDSLVGLAINAGYHSFSRNQGISVNSFAVGVHGSKSWTSGISLYGGLQIENLSGNITLVRDKDLTILSKSPFQEIRNQEDLKIDVTSYSDIRVSAGVSYKTGVVELHADAAYASQPTLSAGVTFWFMNIDAGSH